MAEEGAKKTAHLQLFNAGKYATSLVAALAYIWITENIIDGAFVAWLIIQFFSQAAHCAWDFYVDWGLFRTNRSGIQNRFLREKMIFAPYFYYTAIGVNIFLRFFFLVMIAFMVEPGNDVKSFPYKFRLYFVLSMVAECIRRTMWCIIRMENE
jgi:hypothetical protein